MNDESYEILAKAISNQLYYLFGLNKKMLLKAEEAVELMLDSLDKTNIKEKFCCSSGFNSAVEFCDIQEVLAKLNEKGLRRKKEGVYYTPPDVTNFITSNTFFKFIDTNLKGVVGASEQFRSFETLSSKDKKRLLSASVFDPTCGAGEFLISAVNLKIGLIEEVTDSLILRIASSIYGNDISRDSVLISKIRIFFTLIPYVKNSKTLIELTKKINANFFVHDFINANSDNFPSFDIIIGNPPYLEYRVLNFEPIDKLGNTFANVLYNSTKLLNKSGVMGFIVPLSFVATKRMAKIRQIIHIAFQNICLLNYADRPDCLFSSVHQKLTILIATKKSKEKYVNSSSYNYWYKQERRRLFDRIDLSTVNFDLNYGIPKVGNEMELSIFEKCISSKKDKTLFNSLIPETSSSDNLVYLNMRNCFWIKAFSFNPGSNEYKSFKYSSQLINFVRCLLNSSLFFFFWIAVSDCWHITSKELTMMRLPDKPISEPIFASLFSKLENKLEETKVFVGTKQTEFEYKHKFAKDIIDQIDDAIGPLYNLTQEEITYIKSFILKYRLNDEAKS